MATREIKTTIALDGEQSFKNSIKQISKEFRVLDSEMKTISSQYDVTGDKASFLAEKQSLLATKLAGQQNLTSGIRNMLKQMEDAYEDAGRRLDQLRNELTSATEAGNDAEIKRLTEAVKRAETAFEQAASKVQDYQIQLNGSITKENKIQAELNQTQKAIEATDREIEELGRDSIRAGRQLEDGIGEGAESAERSVRDLVNTMQEDISSIRTSTTFTAASGLWDMASGAFSSVSGFVESTQEYRRQLSFLEFNAEESGFGMDGVIDKMIEAQAVTADASAAVEGLGNLLQIEDLSERQFTSAFQNMLGASVRWPETMKFENLAESFQETLATGKAVGAYAELLERLEVNIEDVNKALEESPSAEGDIDAALAYMDSKELRESYEKYKANNKDLIRELETVARLEYQTARLGEKLANYITTPIKEKSADLFEWLTNEIDLIEKDADEYINNIPKRLEKSRKETMDAAVDAAVETAFSSKEKNQQIVKNNLSMREAVINAFTKITADGANAFTNPQAEINATKEVKDRLAQEAWDDYNSKPTESFMEKVGEDAGKKAGKSFSTSYMDFIDNEFPRLPNPLTKAHPGQAIIDRLGVEEEWKTKIDAMATDWGQMFPKQVTIETENAIPAMSAAGESIGAALTTGFEEAVEEIDAAGEEAGESAGAAFERSAASFVTAARSIGAQYGRAFGDGIVSMSGYAASAASRLASAANSALGSVSTAQSARAGASTPASGNVTAILNLDGRTFARVTAPYMATALAHS